MIKHCILPIGHAMKHLYGSTESMPVHQCNRMEPDPVEIRYSRGRWTVWSTPPAGRPLASFADPEDAREFLRERKGQQ